MRDCLARIIHVIPRLSLGICFFELCVGKSRFLTEFTLSEVEWVRNDITARLNSFPTHRTYRSHSKYQRRLGGL